MWNNSQKFHVSNIYYVSKIRYLNIVFFLIKHFSEDEDAVQPIDSMPGISRFGINALKAHLEPIINNGLQSVLLFGVVSDLPKVRFF